MLYRLYQWASWRAQVGYFDPAAPPPPTTSDSCLVFVLLTTLVVTLHRRYRRLRQRCLDQHAMYRRYVKEHAPMTVAVPEPAHDTVTMSYVFCTEVVRDYWPLMLAYAAFPLSAMPAPHRAVACLAPGLLLTGYYMPHAHWAMVAFHLISGILWASHSVLHLVCYGSVLLCAAHWHGTGRGARVNLMWATYPQWLLEQPGFTLAHLWLGWAPWLCALPRPHYSLSCRLGPLLLVLYSLAMLTHGVLYVCDLYYRAVVWHCFHYELPDRSRPHVRPPHYSPDPDWPLSHWYLCCEDGRQRWYFGTSLAVKRGHVGVQQSALERYQLGLDGPLTTLPCTKPDKTSYNMNNNHTNDNNNCTDHHKNSNTSTNTTDDANTNTTNSRNSTCKYKTHVEAMRAGADFLARLQDAHSGHWPNEYSGCLFLTPGIVFVQFITSHGDTTRMFIPPPCTPSTRSYHTHEGTASTADTDTHQADVAHDTVAACEDGADDDDVEERNRCGAAIRRELIRYLRNHQNNDGGWGQHTEGHSSMLGSVLNYCAMRMLGVHACDDQLARTRDWITAHGGPTQTPMWGKVWLSVLGLYSWDGLHALPPEMALLPDWTPFSLGRMWCHSRVIAVAFSYLYGVRYVAPKHALLSALRSELYTSVRYDDVDWASCRGRVCGEDLYTPPTVVFVALTKVLNLYEAHHSVWLRRRALELNWRHIAYDDENTHFICLGPVNKATDMLVTWIRAHEEDGTESNADLSVCQANTADAGDGHTNDAETHAELLQGDEHNDLQQRRAHKKQRTALSNWVRFRKHEERVMDYLYMNSCGMTVSGYNGSQLWDTSFAVQALCACGVHSPHNSKSPASSATSISSLPPSSAAMAHTFDRARRYVEVAQVREDALCGELFYRHRTRGAWNFSTRSQSWQVSDCTAEGLRVLLLLRSAPTSAGAASSTPEPTSITRSASTAIAAAMRSAGSDANGNTMQQTVDPPQHIRDAIDEILSLRNSDGDGGWCSYEPRRGPLYLELLNSAEIFQGVMVEHTYIECSSSCVHTLALSRQHYPHYRRSEINEAIAQGVRCVWALQHACDGGFYGSWGVCYTYAAWLVASSLAASGEVAELAHHAGCVRLVDFLLARQSAVDGGWGESVSSCMRGVYVASADGSQVVHTAWAVMALVHAAGSPEHWHSIERGARVLNSVELGVRLLMSRQYANGDWPQERIAGIFNGNNPIHYPGYKNCMPVWALGVYHGWVSKHAEELARFRASDEECAGGVLRCRD